MLYLCDPSKNTICGKKHCSHLTLLGECCATRFPEFAVQDAMGKPIRVPDLREMMSADRKKEADHGEDL